MILQREIAVETTGRGTFDITRPTQALVAESGWREGLLTAFVRHTSASLILCENADPTVRRDLEVFLARIAPDGDPEFAHAAEGPDDMPAHVRSVLTASSISIPIDGGRLALGTWQGLYLYEHRHHPHRRRVLLTAIGPG